MNANFPALNIRVHLANFDKKLESRVLNVLNKEFGDIILNCQIDKFHPSYNTSKGKRALRSILLKRDGDLCYWCKNPILFDVEWNHPQSCTIEHLQRRSEGGKNSLDNLALAHKKCNNNRHSN